MGKNSMAKMLAAMACCEDDDDDDVENADRSPERLKQLAASLAVKHQFQPGQIVQWKEGMKYKRAKGPFIVVQVLDTPVLDEDEGAGSQYFRDPLDIVLAHIHEDGEFLTYHYDSRRFEPAE